MKKLVGFTLAEVLITLGIIGIVAALTIPSLIDNYLKRRVTTKLSHFYSLMNQAFEKAQNNNEANCSIDGSMIRNNAGFYKWWNNCLSRELVVSQTKGPNDSFINGYVELASGDMFYAHIENTSLVYFFYCIDEKDCAPESFNGRTTFLFSAYDGENGWYLYPSFPTSIKRSRADLLKSCTYGNFDDPETSSMGRRHQCTALIYRDGWKISSDYPWHQLDIKNK